MTPTQVRLGTIFGTKKTFLFQDNLDPNLSPFVESDMYLPDANHISSSLSVDVIHSKRTDPSIASEPADINPYAIDSLIGTILEACEFLRSSPKFWCEHNPLKNVCKNANTLAHGDVHLVVLAYLQRRRSWK